MEVVTVTNKYNGKKLNTFILDNLPFITQNTLYKLLRKKDIKVNNKRVNTNVTIHTGDIISVYISYSNLLQIVYEDDNILVVNKPTKLEVTGTNSLTSLVHKKYNSSSFQYMPCHRLDRNTTGLVLFAKNKTALDILNKKFKNHEIEKHYLALVYGIPKKETLKMEAYLFKDSKKSLVYISDSFKKGYKKIITYYNIIKRYENSSVLDIQIETGRTHQIRAHLAHIGHPIIGDGKYGINSVNKQFGFKYQQLQSYKLFFDFKTDSGILNYLNGFSVSL